MTRRCGNGAALGAPAGRVGHHGSRTSHRVDRGKAQVCGPMSTERKRRYRRRQRKGAVVLPVECVLDDLAAAAIDSGLLLAQESEDRKMLAIAAGEVLRQWAKKWRDWK